MAKIVIEYRYVSFEKKNGRRNSSEMRYYLEGLTDDMRSAGIDAEYIDSVALGNDVNKVTVNGTDVMRILDGLEIRMLDDEDCDIHTKHKIIRLERPASDWNRNEIEDIPDILMKNAISKMYSVANRDGTL